MLVCSVGQLASFRAYAAEDSRVNATLCDSTSQPVVTVTNPSSLSVATNVPNLTISGTTVRTSQIDVSLNGVYTSSVAVGSDETFTITVGLQQGDNTIALHAYFSCNNTSTDTTVIATYSPAVTPPVDNNPGTTIDQTPHNGGTVTNGVNSGQDSAQNHSSDTERQSSSERDGVTDRIKQNLGIGKQGEGYRSDLAHFRVVGLLIISWLALVVVITGIIIMVIPGMFLGLLSRRWYGVADSRKARRWVRLIGLLCILVGFSILQM